MLETSHTHASSRREKLIEHLFVGELMKHLWRVGRPLEVLRGEVDCAGYDLVLESGGVLRHVQLKASHRRAKTSEVGIHVDLAAKPSGCVLWIRFDPDTLDLGPYLWFGGAPDQLLPPPGNRVGRHTKGNSIGYKGERPNVRLLRKGQFEVLGDIEAVAERLFGE